MRRLVSDKRFNIIYNILRFIYCFILIFYLFVVAIENLSYNTSIFGYRVFVVSSNSSNMTYSDSDVILAKNFDNSNLRVSDKIVLSEEDNGLDGLLMVRKIVDIQGENNEVQYFVNDKGNSMLINNDMIVGKVVGNMKFIALIDNVVQSQLLFFLLVFLPMVLIIIVEIFKTINSIKSEQNNIIQEFKPVYYCKRKVKNHHKSEELGEVVVDDPYDEEII